MAELVLSCLRSNWASKCTKQVSGACLKNGRTLMVTVLTWSSTVPSAMVLLQGNLTVISEKNKSQTTIFVYFEFAELKTGSEVLSIEDGWKPEKLFLYICLSCWVITWSRLGHQFIRRTKWKTSKLVLTIYLVCSVSLTRTWQYLTSKEI